MTTEQNGATPAQPSTRTPIMDKREHQYRCTHVVTTDFGDGPSANGTAIAHLAVIPDGSHWQSRPATIAISVPLGTRPGSMWRVTIEQQGTDHG